MSAAENVELRPTAPASSWDAPLTPAEWDRRYPGSLDFLGFLAGPANVIMQLARAGVGYGVVESRVESGSLFRHPIKRARTTFTYLAVATLGTPEEKKAYRKAVSAVHAQVRSTESSPVRYNAMDPELQLWVAACLYWGIADLRRKFYGPTDPATDDALYRELRPLGTTLQVRADMWPADRAAFEAYWERGLSELHIDDTVRSYLTALTDLKFLHPVLRRTFGPVNRFLTTGFLPPPVREQMRLSWGPAQQRRFERFVRVVGAVNRMLPRPIRQAPVNVVMADFRRRLRQGTPLV